jgi:hypothetical protein
MGLHQRVVPTHSLIPTQSERFMPVAEKTIKPIDLGGIAGGDKFITRGILFKVPAHRNKQIHLEVRSFILCTFLSLLQFAVDTQLAGGMWMYGNDVPMDGCAMKAGSSPHFARVCGTTLLTRFNVLHLAGHEIRALQRVVDSGSAIAEGVAVPLGN